MDTSQGQEGDRCLSHRHWGTARPTVHLSSTPACNEAIFSGTGILPVCLQEHPRFARLSLRVMR
jgi:hypothetical protein